MTQQSAVQFDTNTRAHVGLAVKDVDHSIAFYRRLFGHGPTKVRPGYARFEVAEPPLNLSLNHSGGVTGPNNPAAHFGIQVKSTAEVHQMIERLAAAGVATRVEEQDTCCYAVQNKVWATDPDGNPWEVFVVLDDAGDRLVPRAIDGCCDDDCCREPADTTAIPAPSFETDSPPLTACCTR